MAYDANDPADVKIVTDAVAAREAELIEEHEAEVEGLRNKNADLLGKLKKARQGDGGADNVAEIDRLENELSDVKAQLNTAKRELNTAKRNLETVTGERDTARNDLTTERRNSDDMLVNNELTASLVAANVGAQFLDDVTVSLARQATVKEVDGKRKAFVGDKPLGEFVSEWSQGDRGKHYVVAPNNSGGGNAPPGNPSGGSKKIYEMNDAERAAAWRANPADFDARVAAGENVAPVVKK